MVRLVGTLLRIVFHLSRTSVQKGPHTGSACSSSSVEGGCAKKNMGSCVFGMRRDFQMSVDRCTLLSHEHCNEAQCVVRCGIPRPPYVVGVNIIFFESLFLFPFMKLTIILSISFLVCFGASGRMVAMCVNLERRQAFVMLTLAVLESFSVDQIPISVLMAFIALSQFSWRLSRSPFRYMPSSLKGAFSIVMPVVAVMSGESVALPKSAYLVFRTLVWRPDRVLNSARILRISVS